MVPTAQSNSQKVRCHHGAFLGFQERKVWKDTYLGAEQAHALLEEFRQNLQLIPSLYVSLTIISLSMSYVNGCTSRLKTANKQIT